MSTYPISKALTKKILFMGCEKLYLKIIMAPIFIVTTIVVLSKNMNLAIGLTIVFNMMVFLLIGQFLAKKNPYFVEMSIRHLGYYKFYYAQKKYGRPKQGFFFRLIAHDNKGVKTFKNTNRFN